MPSAVQTNVLTWIGHFFELVKLKYIYYRKWIILKDFLMIAVFFTRTEDSVWGSPERTSDEAQKKSNNSRYLYRQLRHVEKELGLLGPSRFSNPGSYNRAMQQVQGMKGLLEYRLPSSSLEGDQLDGSPSPEESINGDSAKKKCCQGGLPWWFVFVGWILVIATSGVSGYFTMMYGLTYGKDRSISWLISMVVSFFESLFITQPLKVSDITVQRQSTQW